jgi:hypothetical protein
VSTAILAVQPYRSLERRLQRLNEKAIKAGNTFARVRAKKLKQKLAKLEEKFPDLVKRCYHVFVDSPSCCGKPICGKYLRKIFAQ